MAQRLLMAPSFINLPITVARWADGHTYTTVGHLAPEDIAERRRGPVAVVHTTTAEHYAGGTLGYPVPLHPDAATLV